MKIIDDVLNFSLLVTAKGAFVQPRNVPFSIDISTVKHGPSEFELFRCKKILLGDKIGFFKLGNARPLFNFIFVFSKQFIIQLLVTKIVDV